MKIRQLKSNLNLIFLVFEFKRLVLLKTADSFLQDLENATSLEKIQVCIQQDWGQRCSSFVQHETL